ncbi:MAG: hypothetical protein MMC33_009865, partial [Icmadophila ericetorum]|nr:hypothetical protein [Icmadophila ericetorum]
MPKNSSTTRAQAILAKRKASSQASLPQWPALTPLPPSSSLTLDTRLPSQILTIPSLFTASLCQTYISFLSSLPLQTTPGIPKKGEALRVNDRLVVEDWGFAERLWRETGLKSLVTEGGGTESDWGGELVGLNPCIRICRYGKGQFFGQHYDESKSILLPTTPPTPAKTTWTLLIYLTGPATGCVGDETVFYPEAGQARSFIRPGQKAQDVEPIAVGLEIGMALLHE